LEENHPKGGIKMISVYSQRIRGNESPFSPITKELSSEAALEEFIIYELGYGGQITDVTKISVTVVTYVMSCQDTTTYSGSPLEMKRLIAAAVTSMMVRNDPKVKDILVDRVYKATQGVPLLVVLSSGMITGNLVAQIATIVAFDLQESLEDLKKLSVKTLFAIGSLVSEGTCSLQEALKLV
jgi:hypothetical protein